MKGFMHVLTGGQAPTLSFWHANIELQLRRFATSHWLPLPYTQ